MENQLQCPLDPGGGRFHGCVCLVIGTDWLLLLPASTGTDAGTLLDGATALDPRILWNSRGERTTATFAPLVFPLRFGGRRWGMDQNAIQERRAVAGEVKESSPQPTRDSHIAPPARFIKVAGERRR